MKKSLFLLSCTTIVGGSFISTQAIAQSTTPPKHHTRPVPLPHPQDVLRGEAMYREMIAISPNAKLHVALIGRVSGADYLPIAAGVFPAKNGITPFELKIPKGMAPTGPYRLQAWLVNDNRLMFNGLNPETIIHSLNQPTRIMLKIAGTNHANGVSNGKTLPEPPAVAGVEGLMPMLALVKGQVMKLDRRGIAPDAEVEVTISDVSRADAPAEVLSQRKFSLEGKQLPFNFELPVRVDNVKMKPNGRYSISAKVFENGKLTYITDTFTAISRENADKPFELRVTRARSND
jgi:uncharacterized lipoprotein YbaY